jgi:hypothetical protein
MHSFYSAAVEVVRDTIGGAAGDEGDDGAYIYVGAAAIAAATTMTILVYPYQVYD